MIKPIPNRQIARDIGVSSRCINAVVNRETWSHI